MDLLNFSKEELKLRWSPIDDFYVENQFWFEVWTSKDLLKWYEIGSKNWEKGESFLNSNSSWSHGIFTITVENFNSKGRATYSWLFLIDLAGSERLVGNELPN